MYLHTNQYDLMIPIKKLHDLYLMQDERGYFVDFSFGVGLLALFSVCRTTAFASHRNLRMIYINFCVLFTYMEGFYQPEISLAVISRKKYFFLTIYMKISPSCNIALSEICDSIISSSQSPEIRYATIRAKLDSIDSSHRSMLISLYSPCRMFYVDGIG